MTVDKWEDILTNAQREQLIKSAVEALELLVDSKESKDLISDFRISDKHDANEPGTDNSHILSLYLTTQGLKETSSCLGHDKKTGGGYNSSKKYCRSYDKQKIIGLKKFREVVESYQLTPNKISEIADKLK